MPLSDAVNIEKCFEKFDDLFSPKIVAELNGQYILVVRCEGDKVPWHIHDDEDEMFLVLDGTLDIHTRNESVTLRSGEFHIVTKGVEHRVVPQDHVKLMLFEPAGIAHTGSVSSDITLDKYDWLDV
jgi:mannose-6-phosphate isomerase-like protein (cupin superfamily)